MRLLFCIKAMNLPGGGAERVLADTVNGLAVRGHEIQVLSFDRSGGRSFYALDRRIERLELGIGQTDRPATALETLRRIIAMRRVVVTVRPDVAVGFMHSMFIPLGLALIGSGVPVVASEHIVPEHYRTRPMQWALLRATPLFVRRLVCVSPEVRETYPAALRRRMTVIRNAVALPVSGRADVVGPARKTLLSVGRLEPQKDHVTLVRAFAMLQAEHPDWDLVILGDGSLRSELEALVADQGLAGRVRLPGAIRDISSAYACAQLYVQPSRYESQGLSTVEALAHGLPAVGFRDCPGTNNVIRDGVNGALAEDGQDRALTLAGVLRPLMAQPNLRREMSAEALKSVAHNQLDPILDAWEALLSSVARPGIS